MMEDDASEATQPRSSPSPSPSSSSSKKKKQSRKNKHQQHAIDVNEEITEATFGLPPDNLDDVNDAASSSTVPALSPFSSIAVLPSDPSMDASNDPASASASSFPHTHTYVESRHERTISTVGLSDREVEFSPTLKRATPRSEMVTSHEEIEMGMTGLGGGGIGSGGSAEAHDEMDVEMGSTLNRKAPRSSIVSSYDAGGHGGGEEELEHVMPTRGCIPHMRRILNHFAWNLTILLLIAADAVLIVFKVGLAKESDELKYVTLVLVAFFVMEIVLRMVAFGLRDFLLKNLWFLLYSLLTIATFLFLLQPKWFEFAITTSDIVAIVLQGSSCFLRFAAAGCELAPAARQLVSTNKARYQQHGFDLDLTYITSRIIAMGLPSTQLEAVYRNPIDQVAKFFNTMHKDHYLIINLCSERVYPTELFHGRVVRFPFDDHNPCPISTLLQFCTYVEAFLAQDKENVVAVHCKGGKGRTGSFVSCWLLYSKPDIYAEQALKLFATFRTAQEIGGRLQGVSGPSQKRYIGYFEQLRFVSRSRRESRDEHTAASAAGASGSGSGSEQKPTTPERSAGQNLLQEGFAFLRTQPPMELVSLTLNHVAPLKVARDLRDERSRDVHNTTWNSSKNWSLLITHYAPIRTYEEEEAAHLADGTATGSSSAATASKKQKKKRKASSKKKGKKNRKGKKDGGEEKNSNDGTTSSSSDNDDDDDSDSEEEEWSADAVNARNLARYEDTKEFYFPAREKELTDDDDSITFDMTSFHNDAKSLILAGDLKFQIFRGNLSIEESTRHGRMASSEEKPFVYCWFWLNTAFINHNSNRIILRKEQIDEVARDKNVDPEMNLQLEYFCPPRPESWQHAPHPTFHLVPSTQPTSPKPARKKKRRQRRQMNNGGTNGHEHDSSDEEEDNVV